MSRKGQGKSGEGAVLKAGALTLALIAAHYFNEACGLKWNQHGIMPRRLDGLSGILFSPWLHAGWPHVLANASSCLLLLIILFANPKYRAWPTLGVIWLMSGLGTWLIGRPALHIGASSIIYGVIAYLIAASWWLKGWRPAVMSVLVLFLYGGAVHGLLPQKGFISWEGHLAGAVAGLWAARHRLG